MRKYLFCFLLIVICIPTLVGARSLFEVDLGVSGIYHTHNPDNVGSFLEGMGKGENWTVGIGVNTRLSLFNISFLAMVPNGGQAGQKLNLLSSLAFDIPLVTNALYLTIGGGLTTDFTFATEDSEALVLSRPVADVTFADVILQSPIHLKYGVDVLVGSAKIGLFYLVDTKATVSHIGERGGWADLFTSSGSDKVGVMLQLALF
jgi:hypothetical protein